MVFEIHTLWIHGSSALLVGYVRNSGGKNKKEEITHVSNFNEKIIRSWCSLRHQTKRWNPKMAPYIFTSRNGIYIIDLKKSSDKLDEAYQAMKEIAERAVRFYLLVLRNRLRKLFRQKLKDLVLIL